MHWKQELDALVEITMAFAKDVRHHPMTDLPAAANTAEQALAYTSKPTLLTTTVSTKAPLISQRDEIRQRVNNFRKHQEKMARDRENYYLQTKAKMMPPTT
jgi:hypothetical protein